MLFNLFADAAKLSLYVVCAYLLLGAYARRRRPQWTEHLTAHRLAVVGMLTLAVGGSKLIEDVVSKESGPIDEALLWFLRQHVPPALTGFFEVVTLGGSAQFLMPVTGVAVVALQLTRHRFEALLLGASVFTATCVVWAMKAIVGRARPALWEAQWYWGSSFPSGHTLVTAALSTAVALCVSRIWPRAGNLAMVLAVLWTTLVAVSRLVLGVHWPSDVLAAMCTGTFVPLLISVSSELALSHRRGLGEPMFSLLRTRSFCRWATRARRSVRSDSAASS